MSRHALRLSHFDADARGLVLAAQTLADERRHREVEPLHLLVVLVDRDPTTAAALARAALSKTDVLLEAEHLLRRRPAGTSSAILAQAMLDLLTRAEGESARHGGRAVGPSDLLLALAMDTTSGVREVLRATGLSAPIVRTLLETLPDAPRTPRGAELSPDLRTPGAEPASPSTALDPPAGSSGGRTVAGLTEFGEELVEAARAGRFDPFVGRDAELERLMQILARRLENNPVIVGDPGIGKTALVRALAARIAEGRVPRFLREAKLLALDLPALAQGATLRAQYDDRMRTLLGRLRADAGRTLLFVPDLGAFSGPFAGAGELLASALARLELRVVAVATPERMTRFLDEHPNLSRRFVPLPLEAPSLDEARLILRAVAPRFADAHEVEVRPEAVDAAPSLAKRYIPGVALPKSAIDLLDEACARVRVAADAAQAAPDEPAPARPVVGTESIAEVVAATTGVPVARMLEAEAEKLLRMEDSLGARVVGQPAAVSALARSVRRARVGLRDPKRPIGSFLFLGPSGVGKTELAKALASFLFDDEAALTRLDMSEFSEKHTVARLLGAPPGYVDSDAGGFLTEAVRRRPYSVLLFDEMEKAHPDVFDILLQVLDDGRLTDSRGRLAHFQDCVVLFTSNVGSELVLSHEGPKESLRAAIDGALRARYRPEFLNRIDEILVFDPLDRVALRGIADRELRTLSGMLEGRGLTLEVTEAARERLVDLGYQPAFGARPLRRAIVRALQDPLASALLEGGYTSGDTVQVDVEGDAGFSMRRVPAAG